MSASHDPQALQAAVDGYLVVLSRLAGGPVAPVPETARWAAKRLDLVPGDGSVCRFETADGDTIVVYDETVAKGMELLKRVLATPERIARAQAQMRAEGWT